MLGNGDSLRGGDNAQWIHVTLLCVDGIPHKPVRYIFSPCTCAEPQGRLSVLQKLYSGAIKGCRKVDLFYGQQYEHTMPRERV